MYIPENNIKLKCNIKIMKKGQNSALKSAYFQEYLSEHHEISTPSTNHPGNVFKQQNIYLLLIFSSQCFYNKASY